MQAADPSTFYFTQGVLGISVVILALVIRFMFKYYTGKLDEKDAAIMALNAARLVDSDKHSDDYREMAKNDQQVLSSISQAQQLLAAKIESVKGKQ